MLSQVEHGSFWDEIATLIFLERLYITLLTIATSKPSSVTLFIMDSNLGNVSVNMSEKIST